jgi:hypothetical protein
MEKLNNMDIPKRPKVPKDISVRRLLILLLNLRVITPLQFVLLSEEDWVRSFTNIISGEEKIDG